MSSVSFGLPLMLLLAVVGAQYEDCTTGVATDCNTASVETNSPLSTSLVDIIHDLEDNTVTQGIQSVDDLGRIAYYYYNNISNPNPNLPAAYGAAVCDASLSSSQCTVCLDNLFNCIWNACGFPVGAWAQAGDYNCYMHYETYQFY